MDKEFRLVVGGGLGCLFSLILVIFITQINNNSAIEAMVKDGADPIAARCAVNSSEECKVYIVRNAK